VQIEHMLWYRKRNAVTKDVALFYLSASNPSESFTLKKFKYNSCLNMVYIVYDINVLTDKKNEKKSN
jgi:hypothetical protein